mmetsp:Transcript_33267/g.58320  ORF Transcript_33267/g.58320 Transcript_33267/m.58320 type:complete len:120 (+) Transcript_33267:125-484(+)
MLHLLQALSAFFSSMSHLFLRRRTAERSIRSVLLSSLLYLTSRFALVRCPRRPRRFPCWKNNDNESTIAADAATASFTESNDESSSSINPNNAKIIKERCRGRRKMSCGGTQASVQTWR